MSTLNGQELEIFRAGDYGTKGRYTPEDLQQLASDYNPAQHEAPLVIGHPKVDDRAFGWFKKLRAAGGVLFGTPEQVPQALDEAVKRGEYKKRSVAITRKPDGKLMLRHVGLLGAMVPGVLGMADAKFGSESFEEFEFNSVPGETGMAEQQQEQARNAFLDRFMALFSSEPKAANASELAALEQRLEAKFADQIKVEHDARAASETAFADYKAKHEKSTLAGAATAAIARLKGEQKWLDVFDRMGVPELFASVAEGNTAEFEFADSGTTKKKQTPLDTLTTFVGHVRRLVPTGVTFGDEERKASTAVEIPKDAPANADPGSLQFDADIRARMDRDKVDYTTAARRLTNEGKSSASYAAATSGAV